MPTTINLRRPFDFSVVPIAIVGGIFAALTVAVLLIVLYGLLKDMKKKEKAEKPVEQPVFVKPDLSKLKAAYIAKLNQIEEQYDQDQTRIRPAYEGMSKVVREFVYKATGTEVDKFTLAEICSTEYSGLAKLIGEYYQPEFDQISEGDVKSSLEKSRRLVAEWN